MDCCQLEENLVHRTVKREDLGGGNDPENGSPDTDTGGKFVVVTLYKLEPWYKPTYICIRA